jgi:DNA-binding winged helix-turn-helix (wHTH) protein/TolB-like protein/tetratricopeptide (TPR) repeat protein
MTDTQPGARDATVVRFGPFRLDRREKLLLRDDENVALTPKAYEILDVLVRNAGSVVEKDALMRSVWPDTFVDETNLSHHVFTLRRALGDDRNDTPFIETVPRRGYRFIAPITAETDAAPVQEGISEPLPTPPPAAPEPGPLRAPRRWQVIAGVAVILLVVATLIALAKRDSGTPGESRVAPRSIAVLPFRPLVAAQRDEPLELGMTDALINRLSNIHSIIVRPTSAVRGYAALLQDPINAGHDLGVDAVVEGTVQRSGDRLRVSVRLLSVPDGTALWADQFDQRFTDIFAMQDSISERVASALAIPLSGAEEKRLTSRPTADPVAYELYLKGRYQWSLRTPEAIEKSWNYFKSATDRDPRFALGWVGVSDADLLLIEYNGYEPSVMLPRAKEAVEKALKLDDQLAEAHVSRAVIREVYERNWQGAEDSYERALALNPNYATGHQWYGEYLMNIGRFREAIAQLDRALELDPRSLIINSVKGVALHLAGRYDEAAQQLRRTVELDPTFVRAHVWLGMVYQKQGKAEEARAEIDQAVKLSGTDFVALPVRARAYAAAGNRAEAERIAAQLIDISKTRHVNGYVIASILVQLGDYDGAFHWLGRAYDEYDNRLSAIRVDPDFDAVRGDRRYLALVERLKLPPVQ